MYDYNLDPVLERQSIVSQDNPELAIPMPNKSGSIIIVKYYNFD